MIKEGSSSKNLTILSTDNSNNSNLILNDSNKIEFENNATSYSNTKLESTNLIFRNLFQTRNKNYFEKTLLSNKGKTPLTYFINKHCESSMSDIVFHSKIRVSKYEKDIFYVFILTKYIVLTNDYIDNCSINFCSVKNPIIIKCEISDIEKKVFHNQKNCVEISVRDKDDLNSLSYTHV